MVEAGLVAAGFGLLPLLALGLWPIRDAIRRHEVAIWGLLLGVVAFVGIAHTGAAILVGNSYLKFEASPATSAGIVAAGLFLGLLVGWRLLGTAGPGKSSSPGALVGAAALYVALHSVTDGIVLGESYVGPGSSGYPLTAIIVGGTLLHRFAEGSLIVVPAIVAGWKPSKSVAVLLVALAAVPAAYVPIFLLNPPMLSATTVAIEQAASVFASSLEAGFAVMLLLVGLMPRVSGAKDTRWALWAGLAFSAMLFIHFLVE